MLDFSSKKKEWVYNYKKLDLTSHKLFI